MALLSGWFKKYTAHVKDTPAQASFHYEAALDRSRNTYRFVFKICLTRSADDREAILRLGVGELDYLVSCLQRFRLQYNASTLLRREPQCPLHGLAHVRRAPRGDGVECTAQLPWQGSCHWHWGDDQAEA